MCPHCDAPYPPARECQKEGPNFGRFFVACINKRADDPERSCSFQWTDNLGRPVAQAVKKAAAFVRAAPPPPQANKELVEKLKMMHEDLASLKRRFEEVYGTGEEQAMEDADE